MPLTRPLAPAGEAFPPKHQFSAWHMGSAGQGRGLLADSVFVCIVTSACPSPALGPGLPSGLSHRRGSRGLAPHPARTISRSL